MARVHRLNAKDTVTERFILLLRQILILFLVVIIGVLVSVSVNAQNIAETSNTPNWLQNELIREMVSISLAERKSGEAITIAPLKFALHQNQFKAVDVNPLLIAAEFARQGKTIQIESRYNLTTGDELSYLQVKSIKEMLQSMGIPQERIALKFNIDKLKALPQTEVQNINQWQIEFKVL